MAGITAAGVAAAGTVLGGASQVVGALAGPSQTEQGKTLPFELEVQYLDQIKNQIDQIKADYDKAASLSTLYQDKFNTIAQGIEANISPEDIRKSIAYNSAQIASSLGMGFDELSKQGFLSSDEIKDLQSLKDLESQDFEDPVYKKQREDQRNTLMQNLQRQGASPAAVQQALAQFDNETIQGSFTRSNELKSFQANLISGRIGLASQLRQTNFGQGVQALSSQQGFLSNQAGFAQAAGASYGQGFQAGQFGLQFNQALRGEGREVYNQAGNFMFSGRAQDYLSNGYSLNSTYDPSAANSITGGSGFQSPRDYSRLSDRDLLSGYRQNEQIIRARKFSGGSETAQTSNNAYIAELKKRGII